ncbi:MAG TPA: hypothetical protein PLD01_07535 [Mycobacterium sp.]|nr:hypothetical protein [Mycobacterium sp.]
MRILGAALMAGGVVAGLLALGTGVASADVIQVEGSYSTLAACQADGPHVQIAENDGAYTQWACEQGDDGLYYLFLSN